MEKQNVHNDERDGRDDLDLVQVVNVLIKRKWLIVAGTILLTLAAIVITLLIPKVYESNGFFQLSQGRDVDITNLKDIQDIFKEDMQSTMMDVTMMKDSLMSNFLSSGGRLMMKTVSIPDYKKYLPQFTNPRLFLQFMDMKKKSGENDLEDIGPMVHTAEDIAQWIEPVYAYSKSDTKELGQIARDAENFVVGIRISGEGLSPQKAGTFVSTIGDFIEDSIIFGKLKDYIAAELNRSRTEFDKYDNFIIKDDFRLKQLSEKRDNIREIVKRYPRAQELMKFREVIALGETGHRFLSPTIQLVGIESYMADIKENLSKCKRNKALAGLKLQFFREVKEVLDSETFSGPLLGKSLELIKTVSADPANQDLPGDIVREVRNDLSVDFNNFLSFREGMQFIAGPSLTEQPIRPRKALIAAIAFVLGFFLFVSLAFFIEWWSKNKKKIVE